MIDILTFISLAGGFFFALEKVAHYAEQICAALGKILRGEGEHGRGKASGEAVSG